MTRPWMVMLVATMAVGCRSAQPTTNPFLRTTVAPPATGQGAVVVPGEPYYPGSTPPPVAAPAASGAPLTPITPTTPAPPPVLTQPPVAAPPPAVTPTRDNRYSPPGGSFQYNQSSLDQAHPPGAGNDPDDALADQKNAQVAAAEPRLDQLTLAPIDHAVEEAAALSHEPDPVEAAAAEAGQDASDVDTEKLADQHNQTIKRVAQRLALPMEAADMTDAADSPDRPPGGSPSVQDLHSLALAPAAALSAKDTDDAAADRDDASSPAADIISETTSSSGFAASDSAALPPASAKYPQNWRQRKARYIPTADATDSPGAG